MKNHPKQRGRPCLALAPAPLGLWRAKPSYCDANHEGTDWEEIL